MIGFMPPVAQARHDNGCTAMRDVAQELGLPLLTAEPEYVGRHRKPDLDSLIDVARVDRTPFGFIPVRRDA